MALPASGKLGLDLSAVVAIVMCQWCQDEVGRILLLESVFAVGGILDPAYRNIVRSNHM